jgi:hypothetical protein
MTTKKGTAKDEAVEGAQGAQGPQGEELEIKDSAPVTEEDAKRSGDKEQAVNSDVVAMEQEKGEDVPEDKVAAPSFFVDREENHRVEVDILTRKQDGRVVSVARTGIGMDYKQFDRLLYSQVWFEFTMPDYDQMANYRQKSAVYRREAESMLVDKIQLRNYLLVWHLKDWSLQDKEGKKVELKHDDDGSLSEDSIERVYAMQSTILDIVLTVFEKDLLLT